MSHSYYMISFKLFSFTVMSRCWHESPEARPNFKELCSVMDRFHTHIANFTELRMVVVESQDVAHGMCQCVQVLSYWKFICLSSYLYYICEINIVIVFVIKVYTSASIYCCFCNWFINIIYYNKGVRYLYCLSRKTMEVLSKFEFGFNTLYIENSLLKLFCM